MPSSGQGRDLALTVGANLRAAREALGLTQRELALRLVALDPEGETKTDGQRVSDWERGVNRPSDLSLLRLGQLLGRDVAWFYTEHEKAAA